MKHTWKKTAAFVLAMALVVGAAPANVGTGGLFGATGIVAHAAAYTITLPNAENGSVSATVGESIATSADSGATVTLTSNPANGYKLKSISGTYKGNPHEDKSLNGTKNITGTYFNYTATDAAGAGWKLANNSSITISSSSKTITKVEFNIIQRGNSFSLNNVNCSAGTKSLSGNTLSLSSVNSNSLTLSQSVNNAGYVRFNSVKVYYDGTAVDETLKISGTGTSNVYTFTMPESNVTLSAEFEEDNTAVTGVTLSPNTEQTITVDGDAVALTATVAPNDATDKTVKWSTSGESVKLYSDSACTTEVGSDATSTLTVYAKGVSAGNATVTATSNADATKTASCDVTVNPAKIDISAATVNLNTDNSVASIKIGDNDPITDLSDFDITYGTTANSATATFPTAPGKYYAFVTAKTDSENYTGTATSEQFIVNGTLADGTYKQTASKDEKYYTRFVFVKPKSEIEGKSKAKFTAHYNGTDYSFETTSYYTGMTSNGISYTLESEDSVMFVVTITSGSDISADLTCDIDFE